MPRINQSKNKCLQQLCSHKEIELRDHLLTNHREDSDRLRILTKSFGLPKLNWHKELQSILKELIKCISLRKPLSSIEMVNSFSIHAIISRIAQFIWSIPLSCTMHSFLYVGTLSSSIHLDGHGNSHLASSMVQVHFYGLLTFSTGDIWREKSTSCSY